MMCRFWVIKIKLSDLSDLIHDVQNSSDKNQVEWLKGSRDSGSGWKPRPQLNRSPTSPLTSRKRHQLSTDGISTARRFLVAPWIWLWCPQGWGCNCNLVEPRCNRITVKEPLWLKQLVAATEATETAETAPLSSFSPTTGWLVAGFELTR